jgi:Na+/H+-dicarboxylate symporter
MPMTYQTIIGVVCGFAVGIAIREIYRARDEEVPVAVLKISGFLGILFLNSLKMIILPLISFGMITTVLNMDDLASMKRLGTVRGALALVLA